MRIDEAFAAADRALFIGFLVAGDPDPATGTRIADALIDGGVDLLELGVPFSDPLADGPAIQRAHARALAAGMTLDRVFDQVRHIRSRSTVPVVLFTYANPVFRRGIERFCREAAGAGADGLLVVDLPAEEAGELDRAAGRAGLSLISLVAPTTTDRRRSMILARARGFVYLVSREGVTGVQARMPPALADLIAPVRSETDLPVAVGFGISTPDQARAVAAAGADAVVVGSAIVRLIEDLPDRPEDRIRSCADAIAAALGMPP
ncbi:MAG: tryptophan synthase subunit alpha [Methanomicrobiales archaeon]